MLNVGDIAPDFELLSDENKPVRMSDYRGKRVILFFYPKADTSGCTTQACGLRDNLPQFEDANATVIGISPDQVSALTKWQAKEHFGYRLLSDPDHVVRCLGREKDVWSGLYGHHPQPFRHWRRRTY